jgi:ABC-2 type transport system permease protein
MVALAGVFTLYIDSQNMLAQAAESNQFIFLKLFTTADETLPGLLQFLNMMAVFFVPIVGIALGFDAINEERNSGTMSRLLSQPIYRDAVINGKFLAGVVTIAIMVTSIVLLVAGAGLRMIGVPPNSEEVIRLMLFLVVTIFYGAFWLGLSILFSIFFRRVATSALASIAVWIFLFFFMPMLAGIVANFMVPLEAAGTEVYLSNLGVQSAVLQVSPVRLYQEAISVILVPGARTLGQTIQILGSGGYRLIPNPLSLGQSLLLVWPHMVSLIALTAVCFAVSYIKFMREEIRA